MKDNPSRLRVLISSHEFSPDRGSECAVGWNIVTRMAAFHDVTVLCADGPALYPNAYSDAVSDYLERHGRIPGLRIVYVKQPPAALRYARINRRLMKLTRGIAWQPLYYMGLEWWHRSAFERALELGLNKFDIVHQLTPISFRKPGFLCKADMPFFWGPIGGMYKVPWAFARTSGMNSLLFETIRSGSIKWQTLFSRHFKFAVRKANRIWTVTEDERRILNAMTGVKITTMIDTAPPSGIRGYVRQYDGTRPLRVCWSGMHGAIKALPLLLHALESLPNRARIYLDILGEGPETQRWQALAKKLSLQNITWHGLLPYHQALQTMGQADILIHTSFREAASMVVLEALGWGMPVVCHDTCGMAVAVDDTCGFKIPLLNPKRSIQGFRDSLDTILRNPGVVELLSEGALLRAKELSWDAKVREISGSYASIY